MKKENVMPEPTPEPCGCRVYALSVISDDHTIIYCPTHAAAFETAEKLKWYETTQENFWADKYHELNHKRDRAERQNTALLAAGGKVVSLWEAMSQLRPERPWGFANDELDAAEVERMVELLEDLSAAIAAATTTEEGDGGE